MKSRRCILLFVIMFLILPAVAHAQIWSGIIDSKRGMDWGQAGISGTLPDTNWRVCTTISPYNGNISKIQTAVTNCASSNPTGSVVVLGAGTFTLSGTCVMFPNPGGGHVAIRGQGANSTFINSSATGCGFFGATFNSPGDGTSTGVNQYTFVKWTGGYSQGATQITLSSVSGITPGQTMLILNQCDTGFSGTYCRSGSSVDNNGYFTCATPWQGSGTGCNIANESADGPTWRCDPQFSGCSGPSHNPPASGESGYAYQQEYVLVTAINQNGCGATCVTINHPLHHPNWSASQVPQAVIVRMVLQVGVENLSVNLTGNTTAGGAIDFYNCYQCWVSGVSVINAAGWAMQFGLSLNTQVQNNYVFGRPTSSFGDQTAYHANGGGYLMLQNNIGHQVNIFFLPDGPCDACVVAYNYNVNLFTKSTNMGSSTFAHDGPGNDFTYYEGNVFPHSGLEGDHGGHLNHTWFRNFITGWESCANGQCGSDTSKTYGTNALNAYYASRYLHYVGNVVGTPGYHNVYSQNTSGAIYVLGSGYGAQPNDPLTQSTSLFWGNWDTVTNATRWCGNSNDTGWSTICGSNSEVPTTAPTYPNHVPTVGDTGAGQAELPASFLYSSKPAWFGSIPWPAIGPDLSGGNVGQCAGTLNVKGQFNGLPATSSSQCVGSNLNASAWAGHVNAIPAMACYLNAGGTPDGTGPAISFDPNTCYGASSPAPPPPPGSAPKPPSNLGATVN